MTALRSDLQQLRISCAPIQGCAFREHRLLNLWNLGSRCKAYDLYEEIRRFSSHLGAKVHWSHRTLLADSLAMGRELYWTVIWYIYLDTREKILYLVMFYFLCINTTEIPNHFTYLVFFLRKVRFILFCSHSTCEDNMLFSHVKISCCPFAVFCFKLWLFCNCLYVIIFSGKLFIK